MKTPVNPRFEQALHRAVREGIDREIEKICSVARPGETIRGLRQEGKGIAMSDAYDIPNAAAMRQHYHAVRNRLRNPVNAKPDPEAKYQRGNRALHPVIEEPTKPDPMTKLAGPPQPINKENRFSRVPKYRREISLHKELIAGNFTRLCKMHDETGFSDNLLIHLAPGREIDYLASDHAHIPTPDLPVQIKELTAMHLLVYAIDHAARLAEAYKVHQETILSGLKHPVLTRIRAQIAYDIMKATGLPPASVGRVFGVSNTTISTWLYMHCIYNNLDLPKQMKGSNLAKRILMDALRRALVDGWKAEKSDRFPYITITKEKRPVIRQYLKPELNDWSVLQELGPSRVEIRTALDRVSGLLKPDAGWTEDYLIFRYPEKASDAA